jgi:NADH-quinone oxidoreductase subunit A
VENTSLNARRNSTVEVAFATVDSLARRVSHMPLGGILFIAIFVTLFGCLLLFLASKLGKRSYDPVKFETYECGIPVQEKKDTKISVKFYLTAILFIIFDIEIIFMYPWATTFKEFITSGQGLFVLISMFVFLAVFIYGLFWEVKSKALEWD